MASKIKKGKFKNSGDKLQAFPFHVRGHLLWGGAVLTGYSPHPPLLQAGAHTHHFEFAALPLLCRLTHTHSHRSRLRPSTTPRQRHSSARLPIRRPSARFGA